MGESSGVDTNEGYRAVCRIEEVPGQIALKVQVGDRGVLICRDGDEIYAVDEICPHKNQSMQRAPLVDGEIICPHHRYRFDLQTGHCNRRCAPVQTYDVQIRDGRVWVKM